MRGERVLLDEAPPSQTLSGAHGRGELEGGPRASFPSADRGRQRRGDGLGVGLVAELRERARDLALGRAGSHSAAVRPRERSMRMSRGPSHLKDIPRSGLSSCMDETPGRPGRASTHGTPNSASTVKAAPAKLLCRAMSSTPDLAQARSVRASSLAVAIERDERPSGPARRELGRMPAPAESAVEDGRLIQRLEGLEDFGEHDRQMSAGRGRAPGLWPWPRPGVGTELLVLLLECRRGCVPL